MINEQIKEKIKPELMSLKELLNLKKRYFIPIYQRPYDWDEINIETIIQTLNKLNNEKDFIFLGNMEFRKERQQIQIIDGQQRITTLLILLNYLLPDIYTDEVILEMLKIKAQGENSKLKKIDEQTKFEHFLENKEYSKKEKEELDNTKSKLNRKKKNNFRNTNIYKLNFHYIKKSLEYIGIDTQEQKKKFAEKILNNTYVVIINLNKDIGESEAIEIFDAINTTGKPLSTKDIFKIKMYEYTKKRTEKDPDEVIKAINKLYNEIEEKNTQIVKKEQQIIKEERTGKSEYDEINLISECFSQDDILKVYRYILISRVVGKKNEEEISEYKSELFKMSNENFYNRLFLKIIDNNNSKKQFDGFECEELNVEELQKIYECYAKLADTILYLKRINPDTFFAYKMLKGYNRYRWTYSFLPVLYLWRFNKIDKEFDRFLINISKIFEYYSIVNRQVINRVKTFVNNLIIQIVCKKIDEIQINKIIEKELDGCDKKLLEEELEKDIANYGWNKDIACLILAKNAETSNDNKELLIKYQRLFTRKFDIEHICARDDNDKRFKYDKNTLGNLMILEYTINRNIKKDRIEKKIPKYEKSKFQVVKNELNEIKNGVDKYYNNYSLRQQKKIKEVKDYFEK